MGSFTPSLQGRQGRKQPSFPGGQIVSLLAPPCVQVSSSAGVSPSSFSGLTVLTVGLDSPPVSQAPQAQPCPRVLGLPGPLPETCWLAALTHARVPSTDLLSWRRPIGSLPSRPDLCCDHLERECVPAGPGSLQRGWRRASCPHYRLLLLGRS